jgi:exonuclease VII small subunit
MPWILETASGKFIDSYTGREEAETARKKYGILGAKVRAGKVPLEHALTKAATTRAPTAFGAVRVGAVSADDFKSYDNFVLFIHSKGRSQYTKDELTTFAHHMHVTNLADMTQRLRKLGLTPMIETSKMSGGILTRTPGPPPRTVEHVRGKPVEVSGSFKPLPISPEEKAKVRARMLPDVNLGALLEKAPRGSMGKLDKSQAANQRLMVQGLRNLHQKIGLAIDQYNAKVDEINTIIEQLESEKFVAVEEAVNAYNDGVRDVSAMLDQWIEGGESFAENLAQREPKIDPDAQERWAEEMGALEAWLDQIREVNDQLEGLDEETIEQPDVPDPIDEDEFKLPDDFIPSEENAALVASIPEEPVVRRATKKETKKK